MLAFLAAEVSNIEENAKAVVTRQTYKQAYPLALLFALRL